MKIAIDARMYGATQFSGIGTYIQELTDELFKLDQDNEYILFLREPEFSKFNHPLLSLQGGSRDGALITAPSRSVRITDSIRL